MCFLNSRIGTWAKRTKLLNIDKRRRVAVVFRRAAGARRRVNGNKCASRRPPALDSATSPLNRKMMGNRSRRHRPIRPSRPLLTDRYHDRKGFHVNVRSITGSPFAEWELGVAHGNGGWQNRRKRNVGQPVGILNVMHRHVCRFR